MVQFPNAEAPAFVYVEHERGAIHQEYRGDIDRYTAVVAAFFARVKAGELG